ncbi:MAG TPA: alpha/beta hydrolase [Polyangiaceae bacterium]
MTEFLPLQDGTRLHFVRRSGLGETLVFIHGLTDNARSFGRVARALGGYFDFVSYDLRGHGQSDEPSTPNYETADHANDLLQLTRTLQLSDIVLVGHSLGAEIALEVERQEPALVRTMVLVDPPWQTDWVGVPNERRRLAAMSWREWIRRLQSLPLQQVVQQGHDDMPEWDAEDVLNWAVAKHECRLAALDSVLAVRRRFEESVSDISCSTLLVTGETRRGAHVTPTMAAVAKRITPKLGVANIEGAGHGIHRDQFDTFVKVLKAFLRER